MNQHPLNHLRCAGKTGLVLAAALGASHLATAQSIWNGTNSVSTSTNWSDATNWLPNGAPGAATNVTFIDRGAAGGAGTINNVVDANLTILQLTYRQTNGVHNTLIPPGVTLTISNPAAGTNIWAGTETDAGATEAQLNTISGAGGTLSVVSGPTNGTLLVRQMSATAGTHLATLDLSGLDTFNMSAARILVGVQTVVSAPLNRPQGALILAKTNIINLVGVNPVIDVGNSGNSPGVNSLLELGQTNSIQADSVEVGDEKATGSLFFNPSLTNGANPFLFLRGHSATRVSTLSIGDNSTAPTTGSASTGTMNLNGGTVDMMVDTLGVGKGQPTAAATGPATGTLTIAAGTLNANTVQLGFETSAAVSAATGTLNLLGGTLTVNTSLILARSLGGTGVPVGTLNVKNATVNGAASIVAGGGTSTINLTASTLAVGGAIGAPGAGLTSFNATNSTINLAVALNSTNIVVNTLNLGGGNSTVNISSMPSIASYATLFPLVVYGSAPGESALVLGTLPGTFTGYLSNDTVNLTYWLVITNGPPPSKSVIWNGNHNGNWDTGTQNWLTGGNPSSYSQGDFVTFDDTLTGTTNVVLTTTLTPGSLSVSNSTKNYIFGGSGKISGNVSLIKSGTGTLVLDNSNTNDFSGPLAVTAGTVQMGNNDGNGNLATSITVNNNSALVFSQAPAVTFANAVNGAGSVTQAGTNTLTLSGNSSYAGGLNANIGVVRLAGTGQGSGTVNVNPGGIVVAGASTTNAISLAGGTLGAGANVTHSGDVTAQASTTTTVITADPQNPGILLGNDTVLTGTLHSSGNINVITGTNTPNPDAGNGFRLRGTLTSDFSGTITLGHSVKGELQTAQATVFSPGGSGTFVLTAGTYAADGTTNGTYCELNLRNNSTANTIFGNNVVVSGTGLAVVNPLGTAPSNSLVNMGNLTIGGGQELGVHLNNGNAHYVVFNSVTLTGGNAMFAPKVPGLGTNGVGSDLALANISESTPGSGIIMNGSRTLTIFGNNTYSGNTVINSGTVALSGSTTLGTSPVISMAAGSTLDVSANGGTFALNGSQALTGAGTLNGNLQINPGTSFLPSVTNGVFLVTNGTATLQGTTVMSINRSGSGQTNSILDASSISFDGTLTISNLGPAVVTGDTYQLFIANSYSGVFAATNLPALPVGYSWDTSSLGSGTLKVLGPPPAPAFTSVVHSGNSLIMSGTGSSPSGNYAVLDTTNLAGTWTPIATNAFVSGTFSFTNTISPSIPQQFFRIQGL